MEQTQRAWRLGFTLIELMVVMGIIGLLVITSAPAFLSYTQQVRLKSTTREIVGLLSLARQQAISTRQERTIVVDADQREVVIEETLEDAEPRRVSVPKSVAISVENGERRDPDAAVWRFAFQSSGALGGRSVSVMLSSKARSQTVTVTAATGAVAVH